MIKEAYGFSRVFDGNAQLPGGDTWPPYLSLGAHLSGTLKARLSLKLFRHTDFFMLVQDSCVDFEDKFWCQTRWNMIK